MEGDAYTRRTEDNTRGTRMQKNQIIGPTAPPAAPPATGAPQAGRWVQTVHSDVTVPFRASAITGAMLASLAAFCVGLLIYLNRLPLLDWLVPLTLGWCGVWLTATIVFWFDERAAIKRTWWSAEERDQQDYDGDGRIGQPRPDSLYTRKVDTEQERRAAEKFQQMRLEEFIRALYDAGKTDTATIRGLGFSERERDDFIGILEDARVNVIRRLRKGNASPWVFLPPNADQCIKLVKDRHQFFAHSPGAEQL